MLENFKDCLKKFQLQKKYSFIYIQAKFQVYPFHFLNLAWKHSYKLLLKFKNIYVELAYFSAFLVIWRVLGKFLVLLGISKILASIRNCSKNISFAISMEYSLRLLLCAPGAFQQKICDFSLKKSETIREILQQISKFLPQNDNMFLWILKHI